MLYLCHYRRAGGGIPCRPNPAATLLVFALLHTFPRTMREMVFAIARAIVYAVKFVNSFAMRYSCLSDVD